MPKLHPRAFYLFWWKFFWSFLIFFVVLAFFVSGFLLGLGFSLSIILAYAIILLILAVISSGMWAKLFYSSYSFEIARRSLNVKWGIVWKHSAAIPYQRIQNIDVNRGVVARILGLSEVWVQTAGSSSAFSNFGSLRFSEGIIPGLGIKDAEKLRADLLKHIKGGPGV